MENIKTKLNFKDVFYWICIVISLVFLCVMLWLCFNNAIWCDEVFSLNMSKNSYLENIVYTALDVHPPMYYLILKFFMDTFTTIFYFISPVYLLKLVTWIGLVIIFFFAVYKLPEEFPKPVVGIFLVSLFAFACLGDLSIFARMYSYASLFVLVETYYAIKVVRYGGVKNWALFVLFFELSAYTHNFALVASVGIMFYMLLYFLKHNRSQIRNLYISGLFCLLFYFPWLIVLLIQYFSVNYAGFWIEKFTIGTVLGFFKYIFMFDAFSSISIKAQNILISILVIYHFVLAMVVTFGKKVSTTCSDAKYARGGVLTGLCSMFFMFAAGTFVSVILQPILTSRYFSIVFPTAILSVIMMHYYVICKYILPWIKKKFNGSKEHDDRKLKVLSDCFIGVVAVVCSVFSALNVAKVYKQEEHYQNNYVAETQLYDLHKDAVYILHKNSIDQVYYTTYHMKNAYIFEGSEGWELWDSVANAEKRPNIDLQGIENLIHEGKEVIFIGDIEQSGVFGNEKIKYNLVGLFEHEDEAYYNWYILSME